MPFTTRWVCPPCIPDAERVRGAISRAPRRKFLPPYPGQCHTPLPISQHMTFRLSKNDSADIAFALSCLLCGALHFREFKEWLYHVIEHDPAPPDYIFDMLDVPQRVDFKPRNIMGWVPTETLTNDELDALEGLSFLRGITRFEDRISRAAAMEKLSKNPQFHNRVRAFFPFLDLDTVVGPDPDKGW